MGKMIKKLLFLLLLSVASSAAYNTPTLANATRPEIVDVRIGDHDKYTRFVLELSDRVDYQSFMLQSPMRLVIDMQHVNWQKKSGFATPNIGIIEKYRSGLFRPGVTRLVIDVKTAFKVLKFFTLPKEGDKNFRIVIDLAKAKEASLNFKKISKSWKEYVQNLAENEHPTTPPATNLRGKKPLIVIDPGHGGLDPGAIGAKGSYEKRITLEAGKFIKRILERSGKYKVVLTRDKDIFIPLRQRYKIAERLKADLFISIHADTFPKKNVRGASVYTLSEKASDKEADALARQENLSDIIAGENLQEYDDTVARILLDLEQRNTMQESAYLANILVMDLKNNVKLLRNPHRFAGFAVLKSPSVPSILIEMGFLSNAKEEKLLQTDQFRRNFAQGLLQSLNRYFDRQQKLATN